MTQTPSRAEPASEKTITATQLKAAIQASFVRHAVDSKNIGVTTDDDGGVTLRGMVQSWAGFHRAENVCWAAPGITWVDNQLRVLD